MNAGLPGTESKSRILAEHLERLKECRLCPLMGKPVVTCGIVTSQVLLIGQAPGDKEPALGRPFAWTAGKTLFRWFEETCGMDETQFRSRIYMAAVCRCFPGKKPGGGDRVPSEIEAQNCSRWLRSEIEILEPRLVIPVGKLAISQFLPGAGLQEVVGRRIQIKRFGRAFDLIPLPHPSGASSWHRIEPGKSLLQRALKRITAHAAFRDLMSKPFVQNSPRNSTRTPTSPSS